MDIKYEIFSIILFCVVISIICTVVMFNLTDKYKFEKEFGENQEFGEFKFNDMIRTTKEFEKEFGVMVIGKVKFISNDSLSYNILSCNNTPKKGSAAAVMQQFKLSNGEDIGMIWIDYKEGTMNVYNTSYFERCSYFDVIENFLNWLKDTCYYICYYVYDFTKFIFNNITKNIVDYYNKILGE